MKRDRDADLAPTKFALYTPLPSKHNSFPHTYCCPGSVDRHTKVFTLPVASLVYICMKTPLIFKYWFLCALKFIFLPEDVVNKIASTLAHSVCFCEFCKAPLDTRKSKNLHQCDLCRHNLPVLCRGCVAVCTQCGNCSNAESSLFPASLYKPCECRKELVCPACIETSRDISTNQCDECLSPSIFCRDCGHRCNRCGWY
jgi:hypothetical protein